MGHTTITLGLLFGLASLGAQLQPSNVHAVSQPSKAIPTASSPIEDATAAAVVEALRARFAGTDVEFKFESFDSEPVSQQDLQVHGAGQFRLSGGQSWMRVRYAAVYDTDNASIGGPELDFASQQVAARPAAARIDAGALDAVVSRQLAEEFASQPVDFALGPVTLVANDSRYAVALAGGVADFAGEGTAPVSVQAVFDRATGRWLGVRYTLDADAA